MTQTTRLPNVRAASEEYSPIERATVLGVRLEAYVPSFMPAELWAAWRSRIVALVLACAPTSDYSAVGLARAAAEVVAAERPAEDTAWAEVLSDAVIAAQVGRLRDQVDDPTRQQRLSMLRRLQKAALGLSQIPRGTGSPGSVGSPWTEAEFRDLWAVAHGAPEHVAVMLRYRLAVEATVGVGGREAWAVELEITGGGACATDSAGKPLHIASSWAAVVADLSGGTVSRPAHDHKRLTIWLKSNRVSLGRNRGRDAYLKEMWAAASSAREAIQRTRATYSDIERLAPALDLPDEASMRDLLRGRPASVRSSNDLERIENRGTADSGQVRTVAAGSADPTTTDPPPEARCPPAK